MKSELKLSDWLRVLISPAMSAQDVALIHGCNIKTARKIVTALNGGQHKKNDPYVCSTDKYLSKYKHTTRAQELNILYRGKEIN